MKLGARFCEVPRLGDDSAIKGGERMRFMSSTLAALMVVSMVTIGCASHKEEATRAEQAATRAEDAARRAESAASRVEAAAQRAEAAAEKAERMFSKHLRK